MRLPQQLTCCVCLSEDFSNGDFAVQCIEVKDNNIVEIGLGGMYKITGKKFKTGENICPKCMGKMINDKKASIKAYLYKDVECDVCYKKFTRSMGYHSWEGWYCASDFNPNNKTIDCGFGSLFDEDRLKITSDTLLTIDNKLLNLNNNFIICDHCIVYWIKNKLISYHDYETLNRVNIRLLKLRGKYVEPEKTEKSIYKTPNKEKSSTVNKKKTINSNTNSVQSIKNKYPDYPSDSKINTRRKYK